jgi:hypothetical protein
MEREYSAMRKEALRKAGVAPEDVKKLSASRENYGSRKPWANSNKRSA